MKIRKARLKDIPEVTKLWRKLCEYEDSFKSIREFTPLVKGANKVFQDDITKKIRSKNVIVLVAVEDDKVVGYTYTFIKEGDTLYKSDVNLAEISDIYVKEGYRGRGISSQLMEETMKWLKKKGVKYVEVFAVAPNKTAGNIYKKWGFKELGTLFKRKV
jgi:GNAT superfamily N-acetyltransferase